MIVGAGGTEKTFRWIAKSADGWLTTPGDTDIEDKARRLGEIWHEAGRSGEPEISALGVRPDPENLAKLEAAGVTETIFGLPDRSPDEVEAWLRRLAGKLSLPAGSR